MDIKSKLNDYYFMAGTFLFIQVVILIRDYMVGNLHHQIFWFCNFAPMLLAIGFFYKKKDFIKAVINVGLIGQIVALILFSYMVSKGVFALSDIPSKFVKFIYIATTIMVHLVVLWALIASYKIKPTRKALHYSFIIIIFMFVTAILFTSPYWQVNLVYPSGKFFSLHIPFYMVLWPILVFVLLVLPSHWIQKKLYEKSRKNSPRLPFFFSKYKE